MKNKKKTRVTKLRETRRAKKPKCDGIPNAYRLLGYASPKEMEEKYATLDPLFKEIDRKLRALGV